MDRFFNLDPMRDVRSYDGEAVELSYVPAEVVSIPVVHIQKTAAKSNAAIIDTSGWETYRNDMVGYEIKYPKGVEFTENIDVNRVNLCLDGYFSFSELNLSEKDKDLSTFFKGKCFNTIFIQVKNVDNQKHLSVRDWVTKNYPLVFENYTVPKILPLNNSKDITIQSEPAFYFEWGDDNLFGNITESTTFLLHEESLYSINYTMLPTNPTTEWKSHPYYKYLEQSIPITEAIINTFRFTK